MLCKLTSIYEVVNVHVNWSTNASRRRRRRKGEERRKGRGRSNI